VLTQSKLSSAMLLGLTLVIFHSCTKRKDFPFHKSGISFVVPAAWEISAEDSLDGAGYCLSIEKRGLDESGLVSITCINDSIDLETYMNVFKKHLAEQMTLGSKASYTAPKPSIYNSIDVLSTSYTFQLIGLKHSGRVIHFYGKDKTVVVLEQCATEDLSKSTSGFRQIEESFAIGSPTTY
jgi:hypothetical protein